MKLIMDFILITGGLLNVIVLVGLFRLPIKLLPHRILIVFWFFILIIILHFYAALHGLRTFNRTTFLFEDGSRFFLPPLVFLYIKSIFFKHDHFLKKNIIHFIPVVVYFSGYTLPRFVNLWSEHDVFTHIHLIHRYVNLPLVKDAFAIGYFSLALVTFIHARRSLKHHYSNIKEKDFTWLRKFLVSFLSVVVLDFSLTVAEIFFGYNVHWDGYITMTLLIFSMGYLGFNGLSQSAIFLPDFLLQKRPSDVSRKSFESKNSQSIKANLEKTMRIERPYLDPDLTLRALAEKMDTSERNLSAVLNDGMNTSFYDFINSYRVDEAKERLASGDQATYSISGIGQLCGFNSKSTFFRIFKKETGFSPSAYITSIKK